MNEETKQELEQWQTDEIAKLLAPGWQPKKGLTQDLGENRTYIESEYYSKSRYHLITIDPYSLDIIIDQNDHNERYQQRITLEAEEVAAVLRAMLLWHLRVRVPKPEYEDSVNRHDDDDNPIDDDF